MPQSKTGNIVVQNLESELLIYDLEINKTFCLNETSALVYQACNGNTDFEAFKAKHNLSDEIIFLALDLLKKEELLAENFVSPLEGMKRREVIKKIGLTSLVALPIISSLMAPTSAMAAVSCGGTLPPGPFICTRGIPGCEIDQAVMCASCSAMVVAPNPAACADPFPFVCACT